MLSAATSLFPRALRASPMLARAAPVTRVPLARMPLAAPVLVRGYASAGGPSLEEIKARINEVLKSFEKVDTAKLTPTASFMNDLGLDSLDSVEVVMAIEEEFNIVRTVPNMYRRSPTPTPTPLPPSNRLWTTLPTLPMVRVRTLTQPSKRHVACSSVVLSCMGLLCRRCTHLWSPHQWALTGATCPSHPHGPSQWPGSHSPNSLQSSPVSHCS